MHLIIEGHCQGEYVVVRKNGQQVDNARPGFRIPDLPCLVTLRSETTCLSPPSLYYLYGALRVRSNP